MKKNTIKKIKVSGGFDLMEDVEMPETVGSRGIKSPFRVTVESMKVGQAFDTDKLPKHYYGMQKKLGLKLIHKKLDNGKIRVWRKS